MLAGACVLVLAGCSMVKLGYDNLPTLAQWQLERYVSLDATQKRVLSARLTEFHEWHRTTQIEDYVRLLKTIQSDLAQGRVDVDQVRVWRQAILARWEPLVENATPGATELALLMRPAQIEALKAEFGRRNNRLRRDWALDHDQDRIEVRAKRFEERAEWFLGDLSAAQKQVAQRTATALPLANEDRWFNQRQARQQQLLEILERLVRERPETETAQAWVRQHLAVYAQMGGQGSLNAGVQGAVNASVQGPMNASVQGPTPAQSAQEPSPAALLAQADRELASRLTDQMMAEVLQLASARQRRHLDAKLQDWINSLEKIAAEATPSSPASGRLAVVAPVRLP